MSRAWAMSKAISSSSCALLLNSTLTMILDNPTQPCRRILTLTGRLSFAMARGLKKAWFSGSHSDMLVHADEMNDKEHQHTRALNPCFIPILTCLYRNSFGQSHPLLHFLERTTILVGAAYGTQRVKPNGGGSLVYLSTVYSRVGC